MSDEFQPTGGWCLRLYEEKAVELLLYGRSLGLSHSEAEDVLQETFVALLDVPREPDQPSHYVVRAFRNKALNYKRSLWRRLKREFESLRWFERGGGESHQERAAMRCLERLPPEQREVIVLKIWNDLTFDQIAGVLELSPNTVAGRYRYGLEKLRACLRKNDYERLELSGNGNAEMEAAPTLA